MRAYAGGLPVQAVHAFEFALYGPPIGPQDAVVGVSHRGTKRYTGAALARAREAGCATALITGEAGTAAVPEVDQTPAHRPPRTVVRPHDQLHRIGGDPRVAGGPGRRASAGPPAARPGIPPERDPRRVARGARHGAPRRGTRSGARRAPAHLAGRRRTGRGRRPRDRAQDQGDLVPAGRGAERRGDVARTVPVRRSRGPLRPDRPRRARPAAGSPTSRPRCGRIGAGLLVVGDDTARRDRRRRVPRPVACPSRSPGSRARCRCSCSRIIWRSCAARTPTASDSMTRASRERTNRSPCSARVPHRRADPPRGQPVRRTHGQAPAQRVRAVPARPEHPSARRRIERTTGTRASCAF